MKVKLLNYEAATASMFIAGQAGKVCVAQDYTRFTYENLIEYLKKLIGKGHESVIEHISLSFKIEGISRACLQELVRHRIASYSVKSTRWTLKELLKENVAENPRALERFIVDWNTFTPEQRTAIWQTIKHICEMLKQGLPNDVAKMLLPECFATNLVMTINLRSFRNFLKLRTSPRAHYEIRNLAWAMYDELPLGLRELVKDVMKPADLP